MNLLINAICPHPLCNHAGAAGRKPSEWAAHLNNHRSLDRAQQQQEPAHAVLAPSPAFLNLTKTLLCPDCDTVVRIRVDGRPYKHNKPAGQVGVCPGGHVQVGQGLAANPNAPQPNVPVDDAEAAVNDLLNQHVAENPVGDADGGFTDPSKRKAYPYGFAQVSLAYNHSAELLNQSLVLWDAGQVLRSVTLLWAFLWYHPLLMLSNLAGGAAHALGGVHADADGLLHEDLLQPGAHGNQPAGGYFNSAVIKAMREIVVGHLARAFRALTHNKVFRQAVDIYAPAVIDQIKELLGYNRLLAAPAAVGAPGNQEVPEILSQQVYKAIMKKPKTQAAGFGGWSVAMLQAMLRASKQPGASPALRAFLPNLTRLLNLICRAVFIEHPMILALLTAVRGVCLPKDGNRIRPLGISCIFTSLATSLTMASDAASVEMRGQVHASDVSHKVKGGSESMGHAVRHHLEKNPNWVACKLDMKNAFNSIFRYLILDLSHRCSALGPLIYMLYHASTNIYYGPNAHYLTAFGVSQGDPCGMFVFCAVLSHALRHLDALSSPNLIMIRFADDIYIIGLAEEVFARYDAVRAAVATIGLEVQPAKTKLYVPSTVHIDLLPDINAGAAARAIEITDGIKVCGAPVGADNYVRDFLRSKIAETKAVIELIVSYSNNVDKLQWSKQAAFLLLRYCVCPAALMYWARTIPSPLAMDLLVEFDSFVAEKVLYMLEVPANFQGPRRSHAIQRIHLDSRSGGLGITKLSDICRAAYIGSIGLSIPIIKQQHTRVAHLFNPPRDSSWYYTNGFHHADALVSQHHVAANNGYNTLEKLWNHPPGEKLQQKILFKQLDERFNVVLMASPNVPVRKHMQSQRSTEAAAWLYAVPGKDKSLMLTNSAFILAARQWIGAPVTHVFGPQFHQPPNTVRCCTYCHTNIADDFGDLHPFSCSHLAGDRTRKHNAVNATVAAKVFAKHRLHPDGPNVVDPKEPRLIEHGAQPAALPPGAAQANAPERCRGDFLITNQVTGEQIVGDTTVTAPVSAQHGDAAAAQPGVPANNAFNSKSAKYAAQWVFPHHMKLYIFCAETGGRWHPESYAFIRQYLRKRFPIEGDFDDHNYARALRKARQHIAISLRRSMANTLTAAQLITRGSPFVAAAQG